MGDFKQSGGCQCGAVRYTLNKKPEVIYTCHCTECQKQSSSAFGISVRVEKAAVDIKGKTATFTKSSGDKLTECEYCPSCGSRLFHKRPAYEQMMNIKGGSFDDASWIKPAGHIWIGSKQDWVALPQGHLTYDGQPDNYDALTQVYQRN